MLGICGPPHAGNVSRNAVCSAATTTEAASSCATCESKLLLIATVAEVGISPMCVKCILRAIDCEDMPLVSCLSSFCSQVLAKLNSHACVGVVRTTELTYLFVAAMVILQSPRLCSITGSRVMSVVEVYRKGAESRGNWGAGEE